MRSEGARRRASAARRLAPRWLLAAALLAAPVGAAGLEIETGSPDALCPDLTMTREAVSRRLGTLIAPEDGSWKARYTIGHAPEGSPRDFVRLELFGPDGELRLSRDLPLEASCATMADVIALVLDRHFRGLPALAPEPIADVAAEPARAPREKEPAAPAPAPPPPSSSETAPLLLVGLELSAGYPFEPGAGLRLATEIRRDTYIGAALSTGLAAERQALDRGGRVELSSLHGHAGAGWGPRFGPVRTYLGPGLRLTLDRGTARGLPEGGTRYRAVTAAGIHAGVLVQVGARLFVTVNAAADWTLEALSGRFVIDEREVLRPSRSQGWAGVGVGYSL